MRHFKTTNRRASAYIVVMGASMLIALFMLAGLMAIRIQRLELRNAADLHEARLNARSGVELGMFHIQNHPGKWRQLANSTTIGHGPDMVVELIDPVDGDLVDSELDPVVVVSTGVAEEATQVLRQRVNPRMVALDSLQSSIHSAAFFDMDGSILDVDQPLSVARILRARKASKIIGDLNMPPGNESEFNDGSFITGDVSDSGTWPRETPATTGQDVFAPYISMGTNIRLADLWFSDHNLNRIVNDEFKDGLNDWMGLDCSIELDGSTVAVTKREHQAAGIAQDISYLIKNGGTFNLFCTIHNPMRFPVDAKIQFRIESTGEGIRYFSIPEFSIKPEEWLWQSADIKPLWTGELVSAKWLVTTTSDAAPAPDFNISGPGFYDKTYLDGSYVMRGHLLTRNDNTIGNGATNSDGVYVLDCAANRVIIEDSRVDATLVLLESSNVAIRETVNMKNGFSNNPTILARGDLRFELDNASLSEVDAQTNFNPPASPFIPYGTQLEYANDTTTDSYSCRVDGLVYVSENLVIAKSMVNFGVFVCDKDVWLDSANVRVEHDSRFANDPPPGFDTIKMLTQPGSVRQMMIVN